MYSAYTHHVATSRPGFDFVAAHFECERDRYSTQNPNGFVNFGSAQNYLADRDLAEVLPQVSHDVSDAPYHSFSGMDSCKTAVANHLETYCRAPISANQILLGNGVISLLEALTFSICDPGDRVLVPAPVFPGLVKALRLRTGAHVELVQTQAEDNFRVTAELLTNAIQQHSQNGKPIKAILLCSPGNPIGAVYSHAELREFTSLAEQHGLALIVDEIYAQSCFDGVQFQSAIDFRSDHVFVLGGLSKDFGVAGYTVGWLHGINTRIFEAVASQSHFYRLASPAQRMAEKLLAPDWSSAYLTEHRRRITQNFRTAKTFLRECGVETLHASAGLCAVIDLREHLQAQDEDGELNLYRRLLNEHRVHLSPSAGFHWNQPGLFRICVTTASDTLHEGLRRIRNGLVSTTHSNSSYTNHRKETSCPLQTPANSLQNSST